MVYGDSQHERLCRDLKMVPLKNCTRNRLRNSHISTMKLEYRVGAVAVTEVQGWKVTMAVRYVTKPKPSALFRETATLMGCAAQAVLE